MKLSIILFTTLLSIISQVIIAQEVDTTRGEYVARLTNCVACHSVPDGPAFAGGLKMAVPLLGDIYATNITPDPETGIGNYTFEDFDNAMRRGIAKDGHNLYPAMPYTSYAKMSEQDMRALYDYFMISVAPVKQEQLPNDVWLSWRWPLSIWNFLFLDDTPYEVNSDESEDWNRGAYLVQGPGHCGMCHTPRGLFFQEKATDESDSDYLSGAPLDHWSALSLNGDMNSGLGRWTVQDTVEFFKTGHNSLSSAFGTMVEVVNNSTQHMTDDDLNAMAVYLKSLPAVREAGQPVYEYDDSTATKLRSLTYDKPGELLYTQYCASCHELDGKGNVPYHPSLAGNPVMLDPDPSSLINITLNGSLRVITDGLPERYDMPYYRILLTDQQIADIITFTRSAWGNNSSPVTPEQVTEIRDATDPTLYDVIVLQMK